jgi:hypothetical protein
MRDLQARRNALGLKREQVEEWIGCDEGKLKHWEAGLKVPGAQYLMAWLDVLGCKLAVTPDETVVSRLPRKIQEHLDQVRRVQLPVQAGSRSLDAAPPA